MKKKFFILNMPDAEHGGRKFGVFKEGHYLPKKIFKKQGDAINYTTKQKRKFELI